MYGWRRMASCTSTIAYIAIASRDGRFGGLRTANASYYNSCGFTGVYAAGVRFTGPVFIGNITASDLTTPMLVLGGAADVRINGGDLAQANGQPVRVTGVPKLQFVPGMDSHGSPLPARANRGRLD